jgi:hypothetical protein
VRLVEQDAHQLRDGHRGVGVVELDGGLVGQRAPVGVAPPEAAHEGGGYTYTDTQKLEWHYNSGGQLISVKDLNNVTVTYVYSNGKLAYVLEPNNTAVTFTYSQGKRTGLP